MSQLPKQIETQAADAVALTILDCVRVVSGKIGRLGISKILAGSREKSVKRFEHSPFYGILAGYKHHEIDEMVHALIRLGYVKIIGGEYPVVALSTQGAEAIKTRATIPLNLPDAGRLAEHPTADNAGSVALTILECLQTVDRELFPSGITKILTGSDAQGYVRFARHPFYGKLAQYQRKQLDAVMKNLIEQGYVQYFGGVVGLTPLGKSALQTRAAIPLPSNEIRRQQKAQVGLSRLVPAETDDFIVRSGKDRAHAAWLSGESRSKEHIAALIAALDDENGNVRRLAASALGKIEDASAVGPLMELLADEKPQVRQYAIKALGRIGHPAAAQALTRIKDDPNEKSYNRAAAVTALKRIAFKKDGTRVEPPMQTSQPAYAANEDAVAKFLSTARPKPLRGPWRVGFALDFNSKFAGAQWTRTELGDLVYRFKYAGDATVADALATRLADFLHAHSEMRADLIVPIPSTKKERPYDPVPLLARALGKALGVAVNETALVKTRATELQKAMTNLAQKQANVRGAFRRKGGSEQSLGSWNSTSRWRRLA